LHAIVCCVFAWVLLCVYALHIIIMHIMIMHMQVEGVGGRCGLRVDSLGAQLGHEWMLLQMPTASKHSCL
jgi:hypothetical protein